jgi:hypothetical protein
MVRMHGYSFPLYLPKGELKKLTTQNRVIYVNKHPDDAYCVQDVLNFSFKCSVLRKFIREEQTSIGNKDFCVVYNNVLCTKLVL